MTSPETSFSPPPSTPLPFGSRLGVLAFRLVRRILNFLPSAIVLSISADLGCFVGLFLHRERRIARAQIERVAREIRANPSPDRELLLPRLADPELLINQVFRHVGESFGEIMLLDRVLREFRAAGRHGAPQTGSFSCDSTGQEVVDNLIEKKQGTVTISAHIGCFELLAAYHIQQGVRLTVIGRAANDPGHDELLREVRNAYQVETVWRDEADGVRKIIKALRGGGVVAALIDQDTALESVYSPFLGMPAATPVGPLRLAIRQGMPVLTSFIVRKDRFHHHVYTEAVPYDPDDPEAAEKILLLFHQRLEALLARHPEQWVWWHRRWRRESGVDYHLEPERLRSSAEYVSWLEASGG